MTITLNILWNGSTVKSDGPADKFGRCALAAMSDACSPLE